MKDKITITLNGKRVKIEKNITLTELVKNLSMDLYVILARVNGSITELSYTITEDVKVDLVNLNEKIGIEAYKSGLKFLYIVAIKELYGKTSEVFIKHSLDKGLYTEINIGKDINENVVKTIAKKMKELSNKDLPISKLSALRKSAIDYFEDAKELEKAHLFKQMNNEYLTMYELNDYYNYFYTYMPVSTGILQDFELTFVKPKGIVLRFPMSMHSEVPKFTNRDKVLKVFSSYKERIKCLNIDYVPDINSAVSSGKISDLIQINELIHNVKLTEIGMEIFNAPKKIKMILISGPSSSGKTTTTKKLALGLEALGIKSIVLSTDDYFKERKDTPKDENGKYDYERIDALDLKLLDSHIKKLLTGKKVVIPTYNFITGEKEYKNKEIKIDENTVIFMEGLHALNDKLSSSVKRENKFKIYVSPFTPLGIDRHNHISTIDLRLLRRIVRDNFHRGYTAEQTLINWNSVRKGEDKYIFPYQSEADVVYNTALIYEIGALKTYAEPLLYSLSPDSPKYEEAMRLTHFLRCFFCIPTELIPSTSVLREFVGKSYFE